jgi:hypothetical protein
MRMIVQISLLLFIQLTILGHSYSQNQNNSYKLNINVKNLNGEIINTADITIIQLKSDKRQTVRYSEDNRCFIADSLEIGRVIVKVRNQGYDTMEIYHTIQGSRESVLIVLGETNSKYRIINSNKYPIETNGKTVALFAGKDTLITNFFEKYGKAVIVLKSGWYKYESLSTSSGITYLITPTEKQHQQALLADLRKLFPEKPIGLLIKTTNFNEILLNGCHIEFNNDINENEIEIILKSVGAKKWENTNGHSYYVTFSINSGIEILKVAEKLSLMKEVKSISNEIYSTYLPSTTNH